MPTGLLFAPSGVSTTAFAIRNGTGYSISNATPKRPQRCTGCTTGKSPSGKRDAVCRPAKIRRGCLWAIIGLAAAIALVPWQGIIWDGKFPDVECRLKFVDSDNKPVPGVNLTVLTKAGGVCYFYPVDEFVPNRAVTSDAEGRIVFHHTSMFLEFAGHEYSVFV